MSNNTSVLEVDLDYAVRMVRTGCGTPAQAAQVCGVDLADLQARLDRAPNGGLTGRDSRA
jgi:hypothetical protein